MIADIVIAAILVLAVIFGACRGLVKSLLSIVIFILSAVGASFAANHLAEAVTGWIQPAVMEKLLRGEDSPLLGNLDLGLLPGGNLSHFWEQAATAAKTTVEEAVHAVLATAVHALLFLLVFVVLLVVLKVLSRALHLVTKLPVIHALDGVGGALVGFCKGALIVAVLCWLESRFCIFPEKFTEGSRIMGFLSENNFLDLLKSI